MRVWNSAGQILVLTGGGGGGGGGVALSAGTQEATSGTVKFANSNGVTFGMAGSTQVTASVKTDYQSSGAYLTTAMMSNAVTLSNVNVSAGTTSNNLSALTFSNSNGVSFGLDGSTVTATVRTDYQSAGAYLTTAMASNRGSDFVNTTAGLNLTNISATLGSNSLSFSVGNYITTGMVSDAGSRFVNTSAGLNLTSISATFNSNSISLSIGPYITTADLSQNSSKYVQNWKLSGNTAGTTSSAQGTDLWLAGGQGITLSGSSNTISFSVGSYITTADLSANSSNYVRNWKLTGNTSGTTSSQQGTDLWLGGGNGVTISGSSNSISFSVATNYQSQGAYLTTAALSQDSSKYAGTNGAITGGSITVNTSGVSVNLPAYITTADLSGNSSNYARNWKLTGNSAGTQSSAIGTDLWLAGGNGVTLSGSSNSISFSVATNYQSQGAYLTTAALSGDTSKYVQNWKLTGNTAGTTSSAQGTDLWFSGGNSITVSGNSNSIVFSVGNYLTTAALSQDSSKYAGTSTGFTGANISASITNNTAGLAMSMSVAAPGGGGAINVTAPGSSNNVQTLAFANSNGVSWGLNGSTITGSVVVGGIGAGVSNLGNTLGSTGTVTTGNVVFVGSNNITLSQSTGAAGSAATVTVLGASLYTNSFFEPVLWNAANSGTSTYGLSTLGLQPFTLNNYLSFTQLNMIASAALSGTFGGSANTFTFSCGGASSFGFSATASITNSNIISYALFSRGSGNFSDMLFSVSTSSAYIATAFVNVINLSVTGGAATVSASALSSMSVSVTWPSMTSGQSINGASSWTTWGPGYINSNSSTTASAGQSTSTGATSSVSIGSAFPGNLSSFWASNKMIPLPFAGSLTPGEYWLGIWRGSSSSSTLSTNNANVGANHSYTSSVNWSAGTSTAQLTWGGSTATLASSLGWLGAASQATMAPSPGHGSMSATYATNSTYANAAGQPNGAIAFSQINTGVSFFRSWIQFANNRI